MSKLIPFIINFIPEVSQISVPVYWFNADFHSAIRTAVSFHSILKEFLNSQAGAFVHAVISISLLFMALDPVSQCMFLDHTQGAVWVFCFC